MELSSGDCLAGAKYNEFLDPQKTDCRGVDAVDSGLPLEFSRDIGNRHTVKFISVG